MPLPGLQPLTPPDCRFAACEKGKRIMTHGHRPGPAHQPHRHHIVHTPAAVHSFHRSHSMSSAHRPHRAHQPSIPRYGWGAQGWGMYQNGAPVGGFSPRSSSTAHRSHARTRVSAAHGSDGGLFPLVLAGLVIWGHLPISAWGAPAPRDSRRVRQSPDPSLDDVTIHGTISKSASSLGGSSEIPTVMVPKKLTFSGWVGPRVRHDLGQARSSSGSCSKFRARVSATSRRGVADVGIA